MRKIASLDASEAVTDGARRWLLRLASGDIEADELARLRSWLAADPAHKAAFERERATWRQIEPLRDSVARSVRRSTNRVAASTVRWQSRSTRGSVFAGGLLAFGLVLFLCVADPITWLRADDVTATGEIANVTLPDGSVAMLNSDSALSVSYSKAERRVELLRGEAWFQVRPDKAHPFRVQAEGGIAEAVGTAFAVRRDGLRVMVAVTEGTVAVTTTDSSAVRRTMRVHAGEATVFGAGMPPEPPVIFDAGTALTWRNRRIVIDDMPLRQALAEIGRYRPGEIILLDRDRAESRVSAVIATDRLDPGLEGLVATEGLTVTYLTPYLAIVR